MRKGKTTRKWVEIVRRRKDKEVADRPPGGTPKITSVRKEETGAGKHLGL